MNKKIFLFAILPICIGLVAALGYYALFSTSFNVVSSVDVTGDLEQTLGDVYDGEIVEGDSIVLTNNAPSSRVVNFEEETECNIETSYDSVLGLSQKVVDFTLDKWELTGDTAIVQYTLVGDSFTAEVTSGEKAGYELVYYKDNSERFTSPAEAIGITTVTGNLPYVNDANADEYDYCETEEYDTCNGAKIWYVPSDAVTAGVIDWSRASEFLFETSLIQYNAEGEIVIYPESSLTIIPLYDIAVGESGDCTITTTVN